MKSLLRPLTGLLLVAALFVPNAQAAPYQVSREQASLAEEQELLLQQLRRLMRTMEVLQQRFDAEKRTQAAKLLREGIEHLGLRDPETGELTLDELMSKAQEDIAAGQTFSALQKQEQIISGVTRLLAILMDRKDVEDLDKSIQEIRDLKEGLEALAAEEQKLQEETAALREESANEAQKNLQKNLDQIAKAQRELLQQTENKGMNAGTFDLERIERELAKLIRDQETDVGVLNAWSPQEQNELESIEPQLEAALNAANRAERLAKVAEQIRKAAAASTNGEPNPELASRVEGADAATESAADEREVADVSPELYDLWAGRYQIAPHFILELRREGDRLISQATGQGAVELFPASAHRYFLRVVPAELEIVPGPDGRAEAVVLYQGGQEIRAARVE